MKRINTLLQPVTITSVAWLLAKIALLILLADVGAVIPVYQGF